VPVFADHVDVLDFVHNWQGFAGFGVPGVWKIPLIRHPFSHCWFAVNTDSLSHWCCVSLDFLHDRVVRVASVAMDVAVRRSQ